NAVGVDLMRSNHFPSHCREYRRFASTCLLVIMLEPVPALLRVGSARLNRVQHVETLLARGLIHGSTRSKVVRVLFAAVKHDHQGQEPVARLGRHIQLIAALTGFIAERVLLESVTLAG